MLERYYSAAESIAFPLPQGFSSFFSYLGYRTLDFKMFLQYVDRNVLELRIDVLNAIFKTIGQSSIEIDRKHLLLTKVPRIRADRLIKKMDDSKSLRIMGRDHANAILSGANSSYYRKHTKSMAIGKEKSSFPNYYRWFHPIFFLFACSMILISFFSFSFALFYFVLLFAWFCLVFAS